MPATANQLELLKLWRENDENFTKVAELRKMSRQAATKAIKRAIAWENGSAGQLAALQNTGLDMSNVRHGWRVIVQKDGSRDSVFWKIDSEEEDPFQLVAAVKEAMKDITPHVPTLPLKKTNKDTLAIFPVADLHMGLLTDQEEVGEDWDTKKAIKVFESTFGKLVANTPGADTAILAQLGDLTHNDDQMNVTPQSKHQLDVDSRYFLIVRRAVAVMKWAIDTLAQKYPKVVYRGCRGNHDMTTHIAITIALAEHYRNTKNIEIIDDASEFYAHQFGKNMFFFNHGDKAKPERLAGFIANEYAEMWGATKHRVSFSGHVHHEWTKELAGILFRSMGTIIPRDVHAFSNGYGSNRCLMSFTYDKEMGEIASARVNVEPTNQN